MKFTSKCVVCLLAITSVIAVYYCKEVVFSKEKSTVSLLPGVVASPFEIESGSALTVGSELAADRGVEVSSVFESAQTHLNKLHLIDSSKQGIRPLRDWCDELTTILSQFERYEFASFLDRFSETYGLDASTNSYVVRALFEAWASRYPGDAYDCVLDFNDETFQLRAITAVLKGWEGLPSEVVMHDTASWSPQARSSIAHLVIDYKFKSGFGEGVVSDLSNILGIADWVMHLTDPVVRSSAYEHFIFQWAKDAPAQATDWAMRNADLSNESFDRGIHVPTAVLHGLQSWTQANGPAAFAWAREQQSKHFASVTPDALLIDAMRYFVRYDGDYAFKAIQATHDAYTKQLLSFAYIDSIVDLYPEKALEALPFIEDLEVKAQLEKRIQRRGRMMDDLI